MPNKNKKKTSKTRKGGPIGPSGPVISPFQKDAKEREENRKRMKEEAIQSAKKGGGNAPFSVIDAMKKITRDQKKKKKVIDRKRK